MSLLYLITCMLMVLHSMCSDEYKVEPIKGAKVSWQVDPRFQDSSSEEEEDEDMEEEKEEKEEAGLVNTTE